MNEKEINNPANISFNVSPKFNVYDAVWGFAYTPEVAPVFFNDIDVIEGECIVVEIDDKRLIDKP